VGYRRRSDPELDAGFASFRASHKFLRQSSEYSYTVFRDAPVVVDVVSRYRRDELHKEAPMRIIPIVGVVLCAGVVAACNDVSRTADQAADARSAAPPTSTASAMSSEAPDTLAAAVPVPPASTSPIVTGAVEEPPATETPVDLPKLAASTIDSAQPETTSTPAQTAEPSSTRPAQSSGSPETKGGTDSADTNPLSTLSPADQAKSMPMAGHGNNHSSPSLEQGEKN